MFHNKWQKIFFNVENLKLRIMDLTFNKAKEKMLQNFQIIPWTLLKLSVIKLTY